MRRYLLIAALLMPTVHLWADDVSDPPITLGEETATEMGRQEAQDEQRRLDDMNDQFKEQQEAEDRQALEDRLRALEATRDDHQLPNDTH
jgi:hypothetical protein